MWLVGYWVDHGHKPEEILSLSAAERSVWQAVAELNREQRREDMRDAILEAVSFIFPKK